MNPKELDLETCGKASLKRIQRHNLRVDSVPAKEVQGLRKEMRALGKMNLAGSLPHDVLGRVDRIMQQAVQESSHLVEGALGRGTRNPKD